MLTDKKSKGKNNGVHLAYHHPDLMDVFFIFSQWADANLPLPTRV